jgi:hypothetical protein
MPVRRNMPYTSGIYSITFTCTNWLSLFEIADAYNSVYNWFDVLKEHGHHIVGYTIMPNHLHAVIAFVNRGKAINTIISNGKRFMAYGIVDKLEQINNTTILNALSNARNETEIKANKLHKVFETSFDWKWCNSDKMIIQKLDYIHNNPCKGKWNLANNIVEYVHSSAKYYLSGEQGIYVVTHYKDIEAMDLHTLR